MSPAALLREREAVTRRNRCVGREPRIDATLFDSAGGGSPTLEDLLADSWGRLRAGTSITCPLCEGSMEPRWTAGAGVVGGRCRSCGTELA